MVDYFESLRLKVPISVDMKVITSFLVVRKSYWNRELSTRMLASLEHALLFFSDQNLCCRNRVGSFHRLNKNILLSSLCLRVIFKNSMCTIASLSALVVLKNISAICCIVQPLLWWRSRQGSKTCQEVLYNVMRTDKVHNNRSEQGYRHHRG